MIVIHRLFLFLILSLCFGFSEDLVLPDTIVFKEGATLPPAVKGPELKCAILSETETSIRVDRSVVKGISDIHEISKDIIADIKRADPGERRFQELKANFKMPEDSQEVAYYTQIIDEDLDPFLSKYANSQYIPDVQKMQQQVKSELERIYIGDVRRGDRWFTSQEWKDFQKEYEPLDLLKKIERAKADQDLTGMLDLTKKITADNPSIHYPALVQKSIQLLGASIDGVTADMYVNKYKDQLVQLDGRLDTQKALLVEEKDKTEKKAIQSRVKNLETQKAQLNTQITQIQKSFSDLQKKFSDEIARLNKIDLKKKTEALDILQGAVKLKGNPDAIDALVVEIQKAAKLWPGCTGIWSFALAEATDRVDAAVTAMNENRLGDAEAELKKANTLLTAAGSLPPGVSSVKKLIGDDLHFFVPARSLAETVQVKGWDKFPDKYAQLEKALVAPKPLDYPVTHRFNKAAEGWMLSQKKGMDDTMAESDAMVAKFYDVVKDVGFIAASENLLKAKELWSANPKIVAANAEFKGEFERIEKEKKIASFKPLVTSFDEAFDSHKIKEAEAAIKKLETAYPQHPALEQMKFKIKNEKERLAAEEKSRKAEAEKARLEEEHKAEVKQMIINGVIAAVVLIGAGVGFFIWKKKQDSDGDDSSNNTPYSDSPPTVS
ncbi:MAG: hypothetical protein V4507_10580 [Verrucomicrobiota bacterium]